MPTTTVDPIVAALRERNETLATAESLTGGLCGAMLTAVAGVSAVYRGGVIAYATDLKHQLVGVDAEQLRRHGPVHAETARQLAVGVRERLGADWGLATTGVAGPDPQGGVEVGVVFVAVAGDDGAWFRELRLEGNRKRIRAQAAHHAFGLLADRLASSSPSSSPAASE